MIIFFLIFIISCKQEDPIGYSEEFHTDLTKKLRKEGFRGNYYLLKRGKIILSHEEIKENKKINTPGARHFLAALKILKLQEEGFLGLDESISLHLEDSFLQKFPNHKDLSIKSFLNHTSGVGTSLEPGGYWHYSWENVQILEKLLEKWENPTNKEGISLFGKIPGAEAMIADWIELETELSKGNLLTEESMSILTSPTVLEDSYASNSFQYGLGVFTNGDSYWTSSRTNSYSFIYFRIPEEKIGIFILTKGKRSRGDLISWKSMITESIYDQKYLNLSPLIKPPKHLEDLAILDMNDELKKKNIPAVTLALVENFKISGTKAWGVKNIQTGEKITNDTLFRAGSLSKPITALTFQYVLHSKGIPVTQSMNKIAITSQVDLSKWKNVSPKPHLTPLNLMSHSSGITERKEWSTLENSNILELKNLNSGKGPGLYTYYLPGKKSRYSGGGYALIQKGIREWGGKDFPTATEQIVFKRLGMKNSTWNQNTNDFDHVTPHNLEGNPIDIRIYSPVEWGAGGLWTRPEDLALFFLEIQKCLNPQKNCAYPRDMISEMTEPVIPAANLSVQSWMGRGIFINKSGTDWYLYHGGHTMGHKSTALFHKTKGYGIVIMTNSENGSKIIWQVLRSVSLQKNWDKFIH